ncbi:uncharacterized protein N7484_000337 [Penicillium longicatenatum]|uniref:uncharacterized protein n=1 Tax=Penicillium longicatenatum TaxID=1561947 RepID=UPI002549AFAB|nr:uncharacterized protein N7484_000337 [Penicillium longicatenatum]KAJ5660965.1 hypothetical protein N7484_000337 [Penicillium longicatenatum]
MTIEGKKAPAANVCISCAGGHSPTSCPVILAGGAANATSLRPMGSAGAPQAPKAPAAAGPRVRTEAQKARKKEERRKYKAKKKKRVRKTSHHDRGMGRKPNTVAAKGLEDTAAWGLENVESEHSELEETAVPVANCVPHDAEDRIKLGNKQDRGADERKLSEA